MRWMLQTNVAQWTPLPKVSKTQFQPNLTAFCEWIKNKKSLLILNTDACGRHAKVTVPV